MEALGQKVEGPQNRREYISVVSGRPVWWGWGVGGVLGGSGVKDPPVSAGDWTVPALVREDPTCCGANKPVCHS